MRLITMLLVASIAPNIFAQSEQRRPLAYLLKVKSSLMRGFTSEAITSAPGAASAAYIESASIKGSFTGLRSKVQIHNADPARTIKKVEWRLAIFDEQRRTPHERLYLSDSVTIRPGKSETANSKITSSAEPKGLMPERAVALVQITSITYSDGSKWTAPIECGLSDDMKEIQCQAKPAQKD